MENGVNFIYIKYDIIVDISMYTTLNIVGISLYTAFNYTVHQYNITPTNVYNGVII